MKILQTKFEGLLILEPVVYQDDRGSFIEAYNYERVKASGTDIRFIQDNQSFSKQGVVRGLHFQNAPKAQTKLVRVLSGTILDIVVDLRKNRPTYKMVHGIELSAENRKQILVPKGFAHGFSVLSENAEVLYKCDEGYAPEHEGGIRFDDPELEIEWLIAPKNRIISPKDLVLPYLRSAQFQF